MFCSVLFLLDGQVSAFAQLVPVKDGIERANQAILPKVGLSARSVLLFNNTNEANSLNRMSRT